MFKPIPNESGNGLLNRFGTMAMARMSDPHSATRQFYFNLNDNESLDPSSRRWGYAVFGAVVEGIDVLEKLAEVETGVHEQMGWPDVPIEPPVLIKIDILPASWVLLTPRLGTKISKYIKSHGSGPFSALG